MAKRSSSKKVQISAHIRDEFFVRVDNPTSMKVALLHTKKSVLESMRIFQEIRDVRKQKISLKKILRKNVRLINSNLNTITSMLPHVHLESEETKAPVNLKLSKEAKEEPVESEVRPTSRSPIDRIEDQLREIEGRLSKLQ